MKHLVIITVFSLLLSSCERAFLPENPSNSPQGNFDQLWQTFDTKYTYFSLKNLDWDSIYQVYSSQIDNNTTDEELFQIMDDMLFLLKDGHTNLVSNFNVSRNWEWYLDYPDNYDEELVERHYLGDDYRIAGSLVYTILDHNIGYIACRSFNSNFSVENLNAVFSFLANTNGLIMDIRSNGGGSLNLSYALAQRFVNIEQQFVIRYLKTGPEHNDFDLSESYGLSPSEDPSYYKPVILLTNRRSYSAANTFAAVMSNIDHVTIVGDTTGGGGGLPIDFELPNGWRYRFSGTREILPDGWDLELGIPPDIDLDMDSTSMAQGRDDLIEAAIIELL